MVGDPGIHCRDLYPSPDGVPFTEPLTTDHSAPVGYFPVGKLSDFPLASHLVLFKPSYGAVRHGFLLLS